MVDLNVSPVLPLSERLAQLRPSAELLQFYRNKVNIHNIAITYFTDLILHTVLHQTRRLKSTNYPYSPQVAEYDQDREQMTERLEKFRGAAEEQHSSQWKVQQKDEEIGALQTAISDLQVCLFQEREQVGKLSLV